MLGVSCSERGGLSSKRGRGRAEVKQFWKSSGMEGAADAVGSGAVSSHRRTAAECLSSCEGDFLALEPPEQPAALGL